MIGYDAKATVKLGPFSRGGRNRNKIEAADHDFGGGSLTPFNILLPKYDELFISFAESKVTSDYIWDRLDDLWPEFRNKYNPSTLLLNLDNGPENSSRRTQFIKRAVDFANTNQVKVQLAYYPPYHSKYNPVERTHGALEQYCRPRKHYHKICHFFGHCYIGASPTSTEKRFPLGDLVIRPVNLRHSCSCASRCLGCCSGSSLTVTAVLDDLIQPWQFVIA